MPPHVLRDLYGTLALTQTRWFIESGQKGEPFFFIGEFRTVLLWCARSPHRYAADLIRLLITHSMALGSHRDRLRAELPDLVRKTVMTRPPSFIPDAALTETEADKFMRAMHELNAFGIDADWNGPDADNQQHSQPG